MGRWLLRAATASVLTFLYLPIAVIALYAFNAERIQVWPIRQFSTQWFGSAWDNPSVRDALGLSIQVGLASAAIAVLLGSLAAFAIHRFRFFGREVFSLSLVLPALAAGSIFTFSLTLGDYITPGLVSNNQFIGNVVFEQQGVSGNLPLAAAFALVPVGIMAIYLFVARRLGAFEAL